MQSATPLMPKATAVWLVDNTALTFDQIADLCSLHPLEVQGIADGEVAQGIKGQNPVLAGQIARAELEKAEANPKYRIKVLAPKHSVSDKRRTRGPRYTPISKRQDRPNAILWLLRHHPELKDAQVSRLAGTTKPTIESIRERTHWNSANLTPIDPVSLGLCSQVELDMEVRKAAKWAPERPVVEEQSSAEVLMDTVESLSEETGKRSYDADAVFSNFADKPEDDVSEEKAS